MKNILRAEWFRLSKSLSFKILILCNMTSVISTVMLILAGAKGTGYEMFIISLKYILHHAIIGYLFIAVFLCEDYSNHTISSGFLCCHSRKSIIISKIIVFLSGMLFLFLLYTIVTTVAASLGNSFGPALNTESFNDILLMLFCGLLGYAAMGSVIVMVAVIAKKAVITIGTGIVITYASMWLESMFRDNPLPFVKYLYTYQIGQIEFLESRFSYTIFFSVMLITFVFSIAVSIYVFERTELK